MLPKYLYSKVEWQEKNNHIIHSLDFNGTYTNEFFSISYNSLDSISYYDIYLKQSIKIVSISTFYSYFIPEESVIFCNGFQSWTHSREFKTNERLLSYFPLAKKFSFPYGDRILHNYSNKSGEFHGWGYGYVRTHESSLFIGSLDERQGHTLLKFNVRKGSIELKKEVQITKSNEESSIGKHFIQTGSLEYVFKEWFKKLNLKFSFNKTVFGWTSWYNYYTSINEKIITHNLESIQKFDEIKFFQIDDGWQKSVGVWEVDEKKFPKGLQVITQRCVELGKSPGLWLAPYIVEEKSSLMIDHPDWILRDSKGAMVKAGYNNGWSGHFYALDFYNEEFRNYLAQTLKRICYDWGFMLLKIDFLYAAAIYPQKEKSRGRVMYEALEWIKATIPDIKILACGTPILQAIGTTDYCRIGPDISLGWIDRLSHIFNLREGISTVKCIQNTLYRRQLNAAVLGSDPDVFILRKENNTLTKGQKLSLLIVNCLFGSLCFTSDDLSNYGEEEINRLQMGFMLKDAEDISISNTDNLFTVFFRCLHHSYMFVCNVDEKKTETYSGKKLYPGDCLIYRKLEEPEWELMDL